MKKKIRWMIAGVLMLGAGMLSCRKTHYLATPQTFVLVHGAWQAPFVWDSVKAQLIRAGQHVIVVQLPGHGADSTSPAVITMNSYRDQIVAAIDSVNGKVILVGHSLSGFAISAVEEEIPNKIDKLVFLASYIPSPGMTPLALAMTDAQTHVKPPIPLLIDGVHGVLGITQDSITPIFCPDAPDPIKAEVVANYRPDPISPFMDSVPITAANFGHAEKYYIHTMQDEVIGIDLQNQMAQNAGITNVYSLNTSHSPFLSQPNQVTATLLAIAGIQQ